MTTPRDQRRAQMAAAAGRRSRPGARPAGQTAIRSKPVRITLDLSPELYRQLTQWTGAAAVALDVPRVALADAMRAMIRVTTENPGEVLERLRRDREELRRSRASYPPPGAPLLRSRPPARCCGRARRPAPTAALPGPCSTLLATGARPARG
jgi:hypothetical protein